MRKIILLTSVTVLLFLTACTKTYTCACTDGTDNIVYTEDIEAQNKSEAQDTCRALGTECDCL
jgi:hypothetical protein